MNIFDKLKSFSFDKNRTKIFGIKSGIVWGHSKSGNVIQPILYISKPRNVTQEDFELMLDKIEIQFNK